MIVALGKDGWRLSSMRSRVNLIKIIPEFAEELNSKEGSHGHMEYSEHGSESVEDDPEYGTNTGPFPDGTPATGRKATFPGANFTKFEGDKIRFEQGYHDRLSEHKQLD